VRASLENYALLVYRPPLEFLHRELVLKLCELRLVPSFSVAYSFRMRSSKSSFIMSRQLDRISFDCKYKISSSFNLDEMDESWCAAQIIVTHESLVSQP
jgi:hypothetical protein